MSFIGVAAIVREIDILERRQAEMLFVAAMCCVRSGYHRVAKGFAEECVLLLRKIGTDTCEECATQVPYVGQIPMPEFLHEGTVRERLKACGINPEV